MNCAYYNENDPKAAAWLEELIKAGHIASGVVDTRSIEDVTPGDVRGFTQCHFFAGIGGWSYALRLAGWPDDLPVWTGSCPCQPFSQAGKGKGFTDERHLWPAWYWLIQQCRPNRIFGEQVAAARDWFAVVQTDLEMESYAVGAAVLGAHSVGAPHIRQRLYWMADDDARLPRSGPRQESAASRAAPRRAVDPSGDVGDAKRGTAERHRPELGEAPSRMQSAPRQRERLWANPWDASEYVQCRDGKRRPVEPSTFPLAHGVPGRVGLLRGYGNAIVPQVAAAFIQACLE